MKVTGIPLRDLSPIQEPPPRGDGPPGEGDDEDDNEGGGDPVDDNEDEGDDEDDGEGEGEDENDGEGEGEDENDDEGDGEGEGEDENDDEGDDEDDGEGEGEGEGEDEGEDDEGDGEGEGEGEGEDEGEDDEGEGDGRNIEDELEKALSKRGHHTVEDLPKQKEKPPSKSGKTGDTTFKQEKDITPKFNWKRIVEKFMSSAKPPETTYTRPAQRAATQISIAAQRGAAAIKPGERPSEEIYKIAFVFDTSGSMGLAIGPALSEARDLLKKQKASFDTTLALMFFTTNHICLEANLQKGVVWNVDSFQQLGKSNRGTPEYKLDDVLRLSRGGGTKFTTKMVSELESIANKGYNIIIFSDEGIITDDAENWKNFLTLYKANKTKIFFIADTQRTYSTIIKKLGVQPDNFGHL